MKKYSFDPRYYLEATLYLRYFGNLDGVGCDILGELDPPNLLSFILNSRTSAWTRFIY